MRRIVFILVLFYVFIFSSSLALSILFPQEAGYIRIIIIASLWLASFYFVYVRHALKEYELQLPNLGLLALVFCTVIMTLVSWASGILMIPIIYGLMTYISFYPLIYLLLIIRKSYHLTKILLIIFIILCNFLALGVIYDSTVGIENLPFINQEVAIAIRAITTRDTSGETRGSFLFGSSTYVYPFLSIGILSTIILVKIFNQSKFHSVLVGYCSISIIWLGCFFSFSRAPLVLATVMAVYAIFEMFQTSKSRINVFIGIGLLISTGLLVFDAPAWLYSQLSSYRIERLSLLFSNREAGNSGRFNSWQNGLNLLNSVDAWGGYGLSTSNVRMSQLYNFSLRSHYESSILLTFSEGGIFGIIARFIPMMLMLKASSKTLFKNTFLVWSLLLTANLAISPAIIDYSVQLAYFLAMSMAVAFAPILSVRQSN